MFRILLIWRERRSMDNLEIAMGDRWVQRNERNLGINVATMQEINRM